MDMDPPPTASTPPSLANLGESARWHRTEDDEEGGGGGSRGRDRSRRDRRADRNGERARVWDGECATNFPVACAARRYNLSPRAPLSVPRGMTSMMWPGFARSPKAKDSTNALLTNHKWLSSGTTPDFVVTPEMIEADAHLTSQMWVKHPAYKVSLPTLQKEADANDDGVIDADEFKAMLQSSGYKSVSAAALFSSIDADGDGKLTEAEIKMLHQGGATLTSGKR